MNSLGKTVVALGVCVVVFLALFLSRDIGAPFGYKGDGFGTKQEALEDSMGASYSIEGEIDTVEFDDGVIYICKTKDQHIAVSYLFRNRQKTKYYLESYYIVSDTEKEEWHSSKNKVKTNYKFTDAKEVIKNCDNLPVQYEEYRVTLFETEHTFRLYYNRIEK